MATSKIEWNQHIKYWHLFVTCNDNNLTLCNWKSFKDTPNDHICVAAWVNHSNKKYFVDPNFQIIYDKTSGYYGAVTLKQNFYGDQVHMIIAEGIIYNR